MVLLIMGVGKMVEIPIWLLVCFTFAIFVLFMMHLEAQSKIHKMYMQTIINSQLVSKSFQEIAVDMDQINTTLHKLDAAYEYKKTQIPKVSN